MDRRSMTYSAIFSSNFLLLAPTPTTDFCAPALRNVVLFGVSGKLQVQYCTLSAGTLLYRISAKPQIQTCLLTTAVREREASLLYCARVRV